MTGPTVLSEFLAGDDRDEITLSFSEIEPILGAPLAASARRYAAYWSTGNHLGRVLLEGGWRASPQLSESAVKFTRVSTTSAAHGSPARVETPVPDLVLIGCVKTKRPGRHAARDLYTSKLFQGRLARAMASGVPWFIMSARHGLLAPDDQVDAYDETLVDMTGEERRAWSELVLRQIGERFGDVQGRTAEIHAGYEYRQSGLTAGLAHAGAVVTVPLEHLGIGEQLAWYAAHGAPGDSGGSDPTDRTATASYVDLERARRLAGLITESFLLGTLDLSGRTGAPAPGWNALPEFVAATALRERGATSRDVRLFITFMAAMDRARDADLLWQRGVTMYCDDPWAFDPHLVASRSLRALRDVLAQFGVSQRHSVDAAGWRLIAEALVDQNSPREVVKAIDDGVGDAAELLIAVRASTATGQPWYPLLSGPKVSVMWVRMLAAPGESAIQKLTVLPVAVDVQVRKVTEYLGVTETAGHDLEKVRDLIQDAWADCATAVGPGPLAGSAAALDPAIWFMGKWGCTFCERAHARRPVSAACAYCRFGA